MPWGGGDRGTPCNALYGKASIERGNIFTEDGGIQKGTRTDFMNLSVEKGKNCHLGMENGQTGAIISSLVFHLFCFCFVGGALQCSTHYVIRHVRV